MTDKNRAYTHLLGSQDHLFKAKRYMGPDWFSLVNARLSAGRAIDDLEKAIQLIRAAEKEERRIRQQPVKAYCCQVNGFDDCYIPAKTHSKARWRIVSGLRDIGYKESGNFHMVRVIRAPQYDEWAKTAKPVPISFEGLLAELGEK